MKIDVICARCGSLTAKEAGCVNRSARIGAPIYCGRKCAGLARRKHKTIAQKREEKRIYDADYREKNLALLKTKKAERHKRTYDPIKAAKVRKKRMPYHVAYCQRPQYKRWKSAYDKKYRALKSFGEFADAFLTLSDLDAAISERISDYETRIENQTYGKIQRRRREDAAETSRDRHPSFDRE